MLKRARKMISNPDALLEQTGGSPIRRGVVYIVESAGLYKIGSTVNLKKRTDAYNTHNPSWELCLSFNVLDCGGFEHILHGMFKHKRVKGEWCKLETEDFEKIIALQDYMLDKYKNKVISEATARRIANKRYKKLCTPPFVNSA